MEDCTYAIWHALIQSVNVVMRKICPNLLNTSPELIQVFWVFIKLTEMLLNITPDDFDDIKVWRFRWPLQNGELLHGQPSPDYVCIVDTGVVMLKIRFSRVHAAPFE